MSVGILEAKERQSRVDTITHHLASGIRQGRYVPGQRLVEADLTRELNISRGPLREALRLLAAGGLIDLIPNRGAVIKKLEPEEIIQRFQLVDVMGALAIRGYNPKDENIKALSEMTEAQLEDHASLLSASMEFYCAIAKSSNNGLLEEMLYRLNIAHFSRHILQVLNLDATELKKHFQVLVKAVLEGNREKALQAHSSWIKTILTQHNL